VAGARRGGDLLVLSSWRPTARTRLPSAGAASRATRKAAAARSRSSPPVGRLRQSSGGAAPAQKERRRWRGETDSDQGVNKPHVRPVGEGPREAGGPIVKGRLGGRQGFLQAGAGAEDGDARAHVARLLLGCSEPEEPRRAGTLGRSTSTSIVPRTLRQVLGAHLGGQRKWS
jgi:hypothetical protein